MIPRQTEGLVGRLVDAMVRRSVRARFRNVYASGVGSWVARTKPGGGPPWIWAMNHHGWFDGYVAYLLASRVGVPVRFWVEEFDAFPLFAKAGAMRFPPGDAAARAATTRQTVRLFEKGWSLALFPEGVLHPGPGLLPFGRALGWMSEKTGAPIVPIAIVYAFGMHERPEVFLKIGQPLPAGKGSAEACRPVLAEMLEETRSDSRRPESERAGYEVLFRGTLDVNERWDVRKFRRTR
ncbi:MAG: lysophospholipid acyltransferase family protein [Fimbriimonadaceae bacterium]